MEYDESKYEARLAALFERHQSVQNVGFGVHSYKPGLEAIKELDHRLGAPASRLRTVHIAGTNGKGSVCSMLAAQIASKGKRVGLYTSPHLLDFRERIKVVCGDTYSLIPREAVWQFLDIFDAMPDQDRYSFFEITTAMAFWWFERCCLDYVILECGLGGRLDSTNIVVPELAIITSIGLDHCAILGNTREAIAAEKAGIFKRGVPALVASRDSETELVFARIAESLPCPLYFADEPECRKAAVPDASQQTLTTGHAWTGINANTVRAALHLLGFDEIDLRAWNDFPRITGLYGRWTEVEKSGVQFIFDIGHNPPALKLNFERLGAMSHNGAIPVTVIYGLMADKDLEGISQFLPEWAEYLLVAPQGSRAMPAGELKSRLAALRPELRTRVMPSVAEAMRASMQDPRFGLDFDAGVTKLSGNGGCADAAGSGENLAGNGGCADAAGSEGKLSVNGGGCKLVESGNDCKGIVYAGGSTFVVSEALPALETV